MEIKTIYANGCSWVYGGGLNYPEKDRYTTLLGKRLKCNTINESLQGGSNDRIVRKTYDWIVNNKEHWSNLVVLLGWTDINRSEFISDNDKKYKNMQWFYARKKWTRQDRYIENRKMTTDVDEIHIKSKKYYKYLHSFDQSYNKHWHQVLGLQSFMKLNNIKYFMFRSFNQLYPTYDEKSNDYLCDTEGVENLDLQGKHKFNNNMIDKVYFPSFDNFNFTHKGILLKHSDKEMFIGEHPSEKGHLILADSLHDTMINLFGV
jgi:hypothetical protein